MAVLEQLVFGLAPERGKGRQVLASSPGISGDCSQEIVRICEGWGAVPTEGLRRPALLCFPLYTHLSALSGDLHAVVRVAEGLKPIFHAVVLGRDDFQEFDLNPFALAQEDVFLGKWEGRPALPRRELRPGSLAPLVSPPPGTSDLGFVDEAVRQMLANQRLLLPLERASSDSDRFLALVVAGLPRSLRQDLRFASWSPSGTNSYSLAATYRENALFTSWQPYLMTSVFGQLNDSCEEYLEQLKVHLRSGDLAGLERHSRDARIDLSRPTPGLVRKKPQPFSATVQKREVEKTPLPKRQPGPKRQPAPRRSKPAAGTGGPVTRRPMVKPLTSSAASLRPMPRPRPRPIRRRNRGGMRRRFAVVLSAAVLLAGAYYLWTSGHWTRLPGLPIGNVSLQTDTSHGVVDIATIYQGALKGLGEAGGETVAALDTDRRRRGLEMLQQAGELLEVQGRDFLDEVDQTLAGDDLGGVQPAPAERLHERGRVLARELRRLALAQISLRGRIDWRDLSELENRDLEARFDSLLASRHGRHSLEPAIVDVDHLLRSVDIRSRQVGGLARLQDLLRRERWDESWNRRCAAAVDDLAGVRQARARQLREDARALVRLKRAEHASELAARAFRDDYGPDSQLTPAVSDVLPQVHRSADSDTGAPALVVATSRLYRDLGRAAAREGGIEQREAAIRRLAASPARDFDPAMYDDHLDRLRFLLLEDCTAAGAEPDSLPEVCFSGGVRQESLDFLLARRQQLDADGWRSLAGRLREPFLVRWAQHRAANLDARIARQRSAFAGDLAAVRDRRGAFAQLVAAGADGTEIWRELSQATARMRSEYRDLFAPGTAEAQDYERIVALDAALRSLPPADLVGVTVRLDQRLAEQPRDVVAELRIGDRPPRQSDWVRLGPAAPVGSGWVGSGELAWRLTAAAGEKLSVRVLDAASGQELASVAAGGWLTEVGPQDLAALDCGEGVRVNWRVAGSWWQELSLPPLELTQTP